MVKKSIFSAAIFGFSLSCMLTASPPAEASDETLVFGIVPQQAASRLAKIWVPFMQDLSERTGLSITFATMKDIPTFEKCLAQGAYDIAYMNPYHYTTFSAVSGYNAFAHQSEKKLKGLIVVRKDNTAQSLGDLDNTSLAFPSPAAFGASVLPRAEMKGRGLTITPKYVKSHDSVYRAVASGIFPAGGGVQRTFNSVSDDIRDQLRVIYRTNGYTPHAFATAPQVPAETIKKISTAMLEIAQDQPELMKAIGMKGFEPATDATWNDVRALGLEQSQTEINKQGTVKCRLS